MTSKRLIVLAFVLSLIAAGCAQESGGRAERLAVTATDYAFQGMPESISGTTVRLTFENAGKADHEFFVAPIGNTSAKELSADILKFEDGAPFPDYLRTGAVPLELTPGETKTTTFTLPGPGNYTLACVLTDGPGEGDEEVKAHATLGMFQRFTVEGDDDETAALDTPAGEFTARDYTFDVPESLEAGKKNYVFRNAGPKQWHHMVLQLFPEGTTTEEATEAFQAFLTADPSKPPPEGAIQPEQAGGTGIFSSDLGQTIELEFLAGRTYLAACFLHDLEGGPPHAIKNKMVKAFTVPG